MADGNIKVIARPLTTIRNNDMKLITTTSLYYIVSKSVNLPVRLTQIPFVFPSFLLFLLSFPKFLPLSFSPTFFLFILLPFLPSLPLSLSAHPSRFLSFPPSLSSYLAPSFTTSPPPSLPDRVTTHSLAGITQWLRIDSTTLCIA